MNSKVTRAIVGLVIIGLVVYWQFGLLQYGKGYTASDEATDIYNAMKIHSGESEAQKAEAKAEKKAEIQQVIAENKKFTEIVEEDKAEAESEAAAPAKIEKTKPIKQKSKVNKKK